MKNEGEYHLIDGARLEEFEKQGWSLVGHVHRIGYVGSHPDNVLVHRSAPPPQPEDRR
jgi:hypothetical protein